MATKAAKKTTKKTATKARRKATRKASVKGSGTKITATHKRNAILAAGLKRAADSLDTNGAKPTPGTHKIAANVFIEGDIIVAEGSMTTKRQVDAAELLACMELADGESLEERITSLFNRVRTKRRGVKAREQLAQKAKKVKAEINRLCDKHKLSTVSPKSGSVTGEPNAELIDGGVLA